MRQIGTILKWLLMVYGGLTLLLTFTLVGFIALETRPGHPDNDPSVPVSEYIRSAPGLSGLRGIREEQHYAAPRDDAGYVLEASLLDAPGLDRVDLGCQPPGCDPRPGLVGGWQPGDRLPALTAAMLEFLDHRSQHSRPTWFPDSADIASRGWYVYSSRADLFDFKPTSMELFVIHPADSRVYWINVRR